MSYSVQIFNGEGTSPLCVDALERELKDKLDTRMYTVETFNEKTRKIAERQTACVVIPGGYAPTMKRSLKPCSADINTVLEKQGAAAYLSCAGAIACGSKFNLFRLTRWDNYSTDSGLDINKLETFGPYYTPEPNDYLKSPYNYTAVDVSCDSSLLCIDTRVGRFFHAFGPAMRLSAADKYSCEYQPVDYYVTRGNHMSYSLATVVHDPDRYACLGKRLFTGIHPEISLEDITKNEMKIAQKYSEDKFANKMLYMRLADSELVRQERFKAYLQLISLSTK